MINWPTHRPPHGSNRTEIRVAERLRSFADSPHPSTVIWGYYNSSKSGLCDPSEVLILHAQSTLAKSPLGDRRVLAGRNLRECTEPISALQHSSVSAFILHTSIHKAKGLDSKAVILIGMPPHHQLADDYDHFSWFMAVSRARQLLAVVEPQGLSPKQS